MSENNVNGITGADVATTTGIVGATIAIGQYIVNDYVITIAEAEGDYGYTMTITRGTETQTVTLYGLTAEQYDAMLGYLQQAQEAAQSAQTADRDAQAALSRALNAALAAADSESNAAEHASESLEQAGFALQSANDAQAASTAAQSAQQQAQAAQTAAETAKTIAQTAQAAAEVARTAAETAETNADTSASQASQSATNAAQSATDAQHVLDSIPADYTQMEADVADLKSQTDAMSTATATDVGKALSPKTVTGGKVTEWKFVSAGGGGGGGAVDDVQVNGVSVLNDGVANVPVAGLSNPGVVIVDGHGLQMDSSGRLDIQYANTARIKAGTNVYYPITPYKQNESTFYGLAKAAGDNTQSVSANAVGQYTESAKSAISEMLGGSVAVTGTTPSITALPGVRYVCGEVSTIDITVPATGIIDVVFTSGATPAVLTVTPPTGMTMKWANSFDPTTLEANTVYEINIMDGSLGVAGTWI